MRLSSFVSSVALAVVLALTGTATAGERTLWASRSFCNPDTATLFAGMVRDQKGLHFATAHQPACLRPIDAQYPELHSGIATTVYFRVSQEEARSGMVQQWFVDAVRQDGGQCWEDGSCRENW